VIGVIPPDLPPDAESALRSQKNLRFWAILSASAITKLESALKNLRSPERLLPPLPQAIEALR
jgi:hypothetical protein